MLEALITGAASALIGTALGYRLRVQTSPDLGPQLQQLESHVSILRAQAKGLAGKEELKSAIKAAESECHSRAANIANHASAEVMEQLLAQLQASIAGCKEEFSAELKNSIEEFNSSLRADLAADIAAAAGSLDSELRASISAEVANATAPLISRAEVQRAFAQMAGIEAARLSEQQEAERRAALQQARIQEVFGVSRPPVMAVDQQLGELNAQLNQQLGALQQRLSQIRGSRPPAPEEELVDPGIGAPLA